MNNSPSLYTMAEEYRQAAERLNDLDLDEQTITDTLEGLEGCIEDKVKNVAFWIMNTEATASAIAEARMSMNEREKALLRRADRGRQYLLDCLNLIGKKKVETPFFVISARNNAESVVLDDASLLPDEYLRVIPASKVPDKKAIKEAIQAGTLVMGAHLERDQSCLIK
jgi:undecaprenyl pyrophosphate synthase